MISEMILKTPATYIEFYSNIVAYYTFVGFFSKFKILEKIAKDILEDANKMEKDDITQISKYKEPS